MTVKLFAMTTSQKIFHIGRSDSKLTALDDVAFCDMSTDVSIVVIGSLHIQ